MRTVAARAGLFLLAVLPLAPGGPSARARGPEQDLYEEKFIARAVERTVQRAQWMAKSDRAAWVKGLEAAFPGKVGNPVKPEDYAAWFELVTGGADEWRRDGAAGKPVAELFDRVVQRMELGPVPSIRKDEFLRYAQGSLVMWNQQNNGLDLEADKLFRVLDRDGDGSLSADELTTKLREDRARTDADANGRVDREEYRESYRRRVTAAAELAAKVADGKGLGAARNGGMPGWLAGLDADRDGQVALFEWRKGGKSIEEFEKMDLDGDGLLTPDEYARFARKNEAADRKKS
jgi:hypothetical protein